MSGAYTLRSAADTLYADPRSVACPAAGCRAEVGQPCAARKTHSARISRAINADMRDACEAHERICRALGRVRQAAGRGATPAASWHE